MLGVVSKALEEGRKKIRAYHGSPHDFDRFSTDNIGTGEGAQAYGRGLYFAEREGTAQSYKGSTNYADKKRQFQNELPDDADIDEVMYMNRQGSFSPEMTELLDALEEDDFLGFDYPSQAITAAFGRNLTDYDPSPRLLKAIDSGHMYEVNINASPDELLDYDLPLSEQSDFVKSRLPKELLDREGARGINAVKDFPIPNSEMMSNADYSQKAADALQESGIKGVKYADAQTRFSPKGKTHNYVVFDDKLVEIARKYGVTMPVAGAILAGTMTPEQAQAGVVTPQKDGILKDTSDVALETVSGINRAVVDGLNFFTADQVNNVLNLVGSDKRIPNLYDVPYIKEATQGNYMDDGLPRDVVRTGSEFLSPL
jgi:hypothetical protein